MTTTSSTLSLRPPMARTVVERGILAAAAITVALLVLATALAARSWIGRPFPGFVLLPNGVIASVGLPDWTGAAQQVYQHHVDAVGGVATTGSASVYAHAGARPAGTAVDYTLRGALGSETVTIPTALFGTRDYWGVFGGYLLSGGLYLAVALLALWCAPTDTLSTALVLLGAVAGLYALSSVGLYAVDGALRLHVLAEAAFPVALVNLAAAAAGLHLPPWRSGRAVAAALGAGLGLPYALLAYSPGAYSALHGASEAAIGVAGLLVLATLLHLRLSSPRTRPLLRAMALGAVLGIGCPAMILAASGASGGKLPVNVMTVTSFLFPLSACVGLLVEHRTPSARALARQIA